MGGQGSGRPPSAETIIKRFSEQNKPAEFISNALIIPNHSGIASHPEAVDNFVPYTGSNANVDLNSKNLTTTGTITGGHLKDTSLTIGRVPFITTGGQLIDKINFRFITASNQLVVSNGSIDTEILYVGGADSEANPDAGLFLSSGDYKIYGTSDDEALHFLNDVSGGVTYSFKFDSGKVWFGDSGTDGGFYIGGNREAYFYYDDKLIIDLPVGKIIDILDSGFTTTGTGNFETSVTTGILYTPAINSLSGDLDITCATGYTIELQNTVYDDLQFQISSAKTPADAPPTWEQFTTSTWEFAFSVGDYVYTYANELPHWWKQGTLGDAHLHFTIKTAQNTGSDRFAKFEVILAYADTNEVWVEQTLTGEATIPTGSAALKNFYVDLGNVTLTNYLIGCQIKARVKRITATGTEYADDVYITQTGIHLQKDTLGSRTETAK